MKKILAFVMCLIILASAGCSVQSPVQTDAPIDATADPNLQSTVPPTTQVLETEPPVTDPPAPETVPAIALADHVVVIGGLLGRGATVDVVGAYDENYYVVKTEVSYGLVEKVLIRMDGEPAYETWTGYAYGGAKLYDNYYMVGTNPEELALNTKVQVLECFEDICQVQVGETLGYMLLSQLSRSYISYAPSNKDGGDIALEFHGDLNLLSSFVPQEGEVTGTGTVLVSNAQLILGWFDQDDTLAVVADSGFAPSMDGFLVAYQDGLWGYVPCALVRMEDEEAYAQWSGFARSNAAFYDNYYMAGEPSRTLATNTEIQILADLGESYVVEVEGVLGYMSKDQISTTRIVYQAPEPEWSGNHK